MWMAINDTIATSDSNTKGRKMTSTTTQTGYAPINGLNMYYEIHGTGEPLVLLHGGLGSTGKSCDWSTRSSNACVID